MKITSPLSAGLPQTGSASNRRPKYNAKSVLYSADAISLSRPRNYSRRLHGTDSTGHGRQPFRLLSVPRQQLQLILWYPPTQEVTAGTWSHVPALGHPADKTALWHMFSLPYSPPDLTIWKHRGSLQRVERTSRGSTHGSFPSGRRAAQATCHMA